MADNPSSNPSFSSPPVFAYKPGGFKGFGNPLKPGPVAPAIPSSSSGQDGSGAKPGFVPAAPIGKSGQPSFNFPKPASNSVPAENKPMPPASNPAFPPAEKPQASMPFPKSGPSEANSREQADSAALTGPKVPVQPPAFGRPPEFKLGMKPGPPPFIVAAKGLPNTAEERKAGPQPFHSTDSVPKPFEPPKAPVSVEPSQPVPSKFAPPVFGRTSAEQPAKATLDDTRGEVTNALGLFGVPPTFGAPKFGPKTGLTPPPPVIISSKEPSEPPAVPVQSSEFPSQKPGATPFKPGWNFQPKQPGEGEEAKRPSGPEAAKPPFTGGKPWIAQTGQTNPPIETAEKRVGQPLGVNPSGMPPFAGKVGTMPFGKPGISQQVSAGKPPAEQPQAGPSPFPSEQSDFDIEERDRKKQQDKPTLSAVKKEMKNIPPFPAGGNIPAVWRTGSLAYPVEAIAKPGTLAVSQTLQPVEVEKPQTPYQMPVPAVYQQVAKPAFVSQVQFPPNPEVPKPSEPAKPVTAPVSPPWTQPKQDQPPFKMGLFGSKPLVTSENKPVEPSNTNPLKANEASSPPAAKPGPPAFLFKAADPNIAAQSNVGGLPAPLAPKWGPQQPAFKPPTAVNDQKPAAESVLGAPLPITKPGAPPVAAKQGPAPVFPLRKSEDAKGKDAMPSFMVANPPVPSGPPFQPPISALSPGYSAAAPDPTRAAPLFPSKVGSAPFKPNAAPTGPTPPWMKSGSKVGTGVSEGQPIIAVAKPGALPPAVSSFQPPQGGKFGFLPFK